MAHYVEKHFNQNTGCMIPGYWNPDYSLLPVATVPCDTREQAEKFEAEAEAEWSVEQECNQANDGPYGRIS